MFLIVFGMIAQNEITDSLRKILLTSGNDTNKMNSLIYLSKHLNRLGNFNVKLIYPTKPEICRISSLPFVNRAEKTDVKVKFSSVTYY